MAQLEQLFEGIIGGMVGKAAENSQKEEYEKELSAYYRESYSAYIESASDYLEKVQKKLIELCKRLDSESQLYLNSYTSPTETYEEKYFKERAAQIKSLIMRLNNDFTLNK
ncbi:hypothetical protein [Spirosoma foliorum]|uniref:Uncharacterized protein n=1 Tax=Spirosoma foliorum TaxID=2710596 RepID=A0A7G5GRL2_9BACT|nr:hypothetical protein [Spirosoma foliorum]QMW01504.1 hypothetical protein H3H32_26610 [Spirosoma foliorum]